MENFDIIRSLKFLPGIIAGLTIHEFSHAFIAHRCGDSTSHDEGRVTLNPFKHIDWFGFLMLLLVGFGWAKPVQFREENLRKPSRDVMLIAAAGPISNALLAIFLSIVYALIYNFMPDFYYSLGSELLLYGIYINWGLFIFNLIPLPPLDGSHLLFNYFRRYPNFYDGLYKYGSYLFFALILGTILTKINFLPVWPLVQFIGGGLLKLFGV